MPFNLLTTQTLSPGGLVNVGEIGKETDKERKGGVGEGESEEEREGWRKEGRREGSEG